MRLLGAALQRCVRGLVPFRVVCCERVLECPVEVRDDVDAVPALDDAILDAAVYADHY